MTTPWIEHCKTYAKKHKCSYGEALKKAKYSYKTMKGGGACSSTEKKMQPQVSDYEYNNMNLLVPKIKKVGLYGDLAGLISEYVGDCKDDIDESILRNHKIWASATVSRNKKILNQVNNRLNYLDGKRKTFPTTQKKK